MKKNFLLCLTIIVSIAFLQSCDNNPVTVVSLDSFSAVEMPKKLANGDAFPTDSTTINNWLSKLTVDSEGVQNDPMIIGHSWGLWQALTELTDQTYEGRKLRRFETWYTPQDVIKATKKKVALKDLRRSVGNLQMRKKFNFGHETNLNASAGDISGKVKYSPGMAEQALKERYFDTLVLKSKIVAGKINSVAFKPNNMMLKPIYRVLTKLNKVKEDTYYFNIWAGKQDGGKQDSLFSKVIKVTTDLNSPLVKKGDTLTYSIKNFIYHKMSEDEAYTYNKSSKEGQEFKDVAKVGDPVILLGMHAASRETRRWTWQSFYWTETPDKPVFPSSSTVAAGRKKLNPALDAPTNHYAVTIAYSMMSPALPYKGLPVDIVKSGASPVYGFNPYIEGTFTKGVFSDQDQFYKGDYEKQFYKGNVDGITSNCMSCHSQASYLGNRFNNFVADQYVNRNAPWFEGSVQLDFAWSLFPGFEPPPSKVTKPTKK